MASFKNVCESFNSHATTYKYRTGGATVRVAEHAISLLRDLPISPRVLDNACGPGFATLELLKVYPSAKVSCADVAPGMITLVEEAIVANNLKDNVDAAVMDAGNLLFEAETFDASITNFGIFFVPDPVDGAREIYRTLKTGGSAIVTAWKVIPFMGVLHAVQEMLKPGSTPITVDVLERWTKQETMETTLRSGGFGVVEMSDKEVLWSNESIEVAAKYLAEHLKSLIGDLWTETEKEGVLDATTKLFTTRGDEFFTKSDEGINFRLVAWIAKAIK